MNQVTKIIGEAVRAKREKLGLSLRQLSKIVGVSYSSLSRIEHFKASMDIDTLSPLTDWLEIPLDPLIKPDFQTITIAPGNTVKAIGRVISNDPNLSPESKARLEQIFTRLYEIYTTI